MYNYYILKIFLNLLIIKGKKNKAYNILIDLLFLLKKNNKKILVYLIKIINLIKPNVILFNKRRGSVIYELPQFLSWNQKNIYSLKWLIKISKNSKKNIKKSLQEEINNILKKKSEILKKKELIIKKSMENKPFFYLLKP